MLKIETSFEAFMERLGRYEENVVRPDWKEPDKEFASLVGGAVLQAALLDPLGQERPLPADIGRRIEYMPSVVRRWASGAAEPGRHVKAVVAEFLLQTLSERKRRAEERSRRSHGIFRRVSVALQDTDQNPETD